MQLVTQPAIPVPKPNELRLVEQQIQAPRCADDVHLQPSMSAHHKQEVLAMVRTCITVRTNAAQHIKRLAEHAQLIPSFHLFRALVLEDLRAAYDDDRTNQTRCAKNRRLSWMALFKPFAKQNSINQALHIQALDRSGNYQCDLIDKAPRDQWEQFVKLGAVYGIGEAKLNTLYQEALLSGT